MRRSGFYRACFAALLLCGGAAAQGQQSFSAGVLSNNPVAYWRLNDSGNPATNNSPAADATGNFKGVYGSAVKNGFNNVAGPRPPGFAGFESTNAAAQFTTNIANSWVTAPALGLGTNTVTIAAWVYPLTTPVHAAGIVFCRPGSDASGFNFSDGGILGYTWNQNNANTYNWNSGLTVPSLQWSFVALVISPSSAVIYLCNASGQFAATNAIAHTSEAFNATTYIGDDPADGGNGGRDFNGYIDEVAVFKSSLSKSQIFNLYSNSVSHAPVPGVLTASPSSSVYAGTTVTFSIPVIGAAPFQYQWQTNGGNIAGATNSAFVLTNAAVGNSGSYSVVISNAYGSTNSATLVLTVTPPPPVPPGALAILANHPVAYYRLSETGSTAGGTLSAADSAGTFTATYGGNATDGVPGPRPSDGYTGFDSLNTGVSFANNVADSLVTIPALNLNTNTVTITAWVYPTAVPASYAGIVFCRPANDASGMNFTSGGQIGYTWNQNNQNTWAWMSGLVPPLQQWSFVALVISPNSAVAWMLNSAGQSSATNAIAHTAEAFNGVTLIGDDGADGGNGSRAFTGKMDEVAIFNSALSQSQIFNMYYGATGGAPFASAPTISPSNIVYGGATVVLSENAYGSTPFQYQWLSNSVALPGATSSSLILPNATVADSASYSVIVSNSYGFTNSPSVVLTVRPPGGPSFTQQPAPVAATNYVNGLVSFGAVVGGSPPLSLQWQLDGTNVPGQTASSLTLANLQTNQAGTYTLVASNAFGVTNSAPVTLTVLVQPNAAALNMLTYHNDNTRQGQNTNEVLLTLANVNTTSFGKLFTQKLDGHVYAEPLYVSGLAIPGMGTHNVVFVCTEHNTVYAFDADSNAGSNGGLLWSTNLGVSAIMPNNDFGNRYGAYHDLTPEIGITGTPVIDLATGTFYVCAFTHEGNNNYVHRIHALSITTGAEQPNSPVVVKASVPGTGVDSTNGVVGFNPEQHLQRPGLTLAGNMLFVAFGSHADTDPYHGWVLGYDKTTLQLGTNWVFNTTPNATTKVFGVNAAEGALWMGGNGLCVDGSNSLYFMTGNGSFSANTNGSDYSDSFIRLSTTNGLGVADYFTPYNQASLSSGDADVGSGGALLLPDNAGSAAHPHLIEGCGKEGKIYLIDRDNMGRFNSANDSQIVQEVPGAVGGTWSSAAYFNYHIYYQGNGDVMKSFTVSNATVSTSPVSRSSDSFGFPGATPAVSANGTQNGIVWILQADAYSSGGPEVLRAYNATNLSQEIYNSSQNLTRDNPGGAVKMTVPTVMNGKVYVGAEFALSVYGNAIFLPAPTISPNGGTFTNGVAVTISGAPGASLYYTLNGTQPTTNSLLYTGPFILASNANVQVIAVESGAVNSGIASASFVNTAASGNGNGLLGQYYSNQLMTFTGPASLIRTDAVVNFTWGGVAPDPSVSPTNFTARWTGSVVPQYNETYTFYLTTSDGARLWINGQQIINQWQDQTAKTFSNSIPLAAQQRYNLQLDYYDHFDPAQIQLAWSSPSTPLQPIPAAQLYPVTNPAPTVVLTAPAAGSSSTAAASVSLVANADAPFNPIASVSFYGNGAYLGAVSNLPYALTATGLAAGAWSFTAVATDGSGLSATSAPVNVMVNAGTGVAYGLSNRVGSPAFFNMPTTFLGSLPSLLSQTGIFSNTPAMTPSGGLIPYTPNVSLWSDGALKIRYLSVPGGGGAASPGQQIGFAPTGTWTFPAGTVFVKTFELLTNQSDPSSVHRLETRLLVRDVNGAVYGVTYKWRADNTEADLLTSSLTEAIPITTPSNVITQNWYYPSPADCLTCHTPVANYVLGVSTRQLNGTQTYPSTGVTDNQLRALNRVGMFYPAFDEAAIGGFEKLSALTNQTATLQDRVRSYLDANCAQCHQPGGTGPTFDGRYDTPLTNQNLINAPVLATLGYDNAAVIKPDDVWRSVLYDRVNALDPTIKMPPLARNLIDTNAVAVMAAWINSLPGTPALAPPVLTPAAGTYTNSVTVTIQPPNTNATLYFTLDGSLPTTNSHLYSGPILLTSNAVVSANAFQSGFVNSVAASASYAVVEPLNTFFGFGFGSGVFQLQLMGVPGSNYILQSSTDLITWLPLSTNAAGSAPILFTDPTATNSGRKFYRAVQTH